MDITLTNVKDDSAIGLLANVIKEQQEHLVEETSLKRSAERACDEQKTICEELQEKYDSVCRDIREKQRNINKLHEDHEALTKDFENLREERNSLEGKVHTLEKGLTECKALLNEQVKLLHAVSENLENEKERNESQRAELENRQNELEQLKQEKSVQEETIKQSQAEVSSLTMGYYLEKTNSLKLVLLTVDMLLQDGPFSVFIKSAIQEIEEFSNQVRTTEDFKFKIKAKNSWLTRLSSLCWWSLEDSVKGYIPKEMGESSGLMMTFNEFLDFLSTIGLKIEIPIGNFDSTIQNYEADYDGEISYFKQLFPDYLTTKFILCEISGLSFNGNLGNCIGLNP